MSFVAARLDVPSSVPSYTSVAARLDVETTEPHVRVDAEVVLVAPDGTRTVVLSGGGDTNPGGETSFFFAAPIQMPGEYTFVVSLVAPSWAEKITFDVRAW